MTERALVLQRVVYAGLDALRLVLAPDLCACLHAGATDSPQLYLRAPELSSLSATEAFTLFSALRAAAVSEPATSGPPNVPKPFCLVEPT